jgi:hypothetical protein
LVSVQSAEEVLAVAAQELMDDMCIGMISTENERGALSALQQALFSMARLLALNLISDDTIEKAASVVDELTEAGYSGSRRPDLLTPKQDRALIVAENRFQKTRIFATLKFFASPSI